MRYAVLVGVALALTASPAVKARRPPGTVLEREVEAIRQGLRSRKGEDKLAAARQARLLGRRLPGLANGLAKILDDPDEQVRYEAVVVLCEMGPVAYRETGRIAERLKDESQRVRVGAADACCHMGAIAREAVPALIKALDDKDEYVQGRVMAALTNIGGASKPAIPRVKKFLTSKNKALAETARICIIGIEKDKW